MVSTVSDSGGHHIVLRPNASTSWRMNVYIFSAISVASLTIAVAFGLMGLWPIIPFAGLELAALGGCLYLCNRRTTARQVITVADHLVSVEKGHRSPEHRWEFPRAWVSLNLQLPRYNASPRVLIRSHGRSVEIGEFLNDDERRDLATTLQHAINRTTAPSVPSARESDAPLNRTDITH